jgi:hypothetical protein
MRSSFGVKRKNITFYGNRIDPSPKDKNTLEIYQFEATLNFWASRKKQTVFELRFVSSKQDYPVATKCCYMFSATVCGQEIIVNVSTHLPSLTEFRVLRLTMSLKPPERPDNPPRYCRLRLKCDGTR